MIFAPAIGPTLSGWVIEHYDWRILFNGMVPLGPDRHCFLHFSF
ncbi:MAG: hypothetical protein ACOX0J_11335 [Thermoactinomyces vulgaris]